jgi:glutathione S-transferase
MPRPTLRSVTKPKLTYFDAPTSRGEECRLALFAAGVDFIDNRIQRSDWPALKPTTPFGALPVFELEGKPAVSQTNAILGHIGRRYGLLPADEWEALRLESLVAASEELRTTISATFGIADPEELKRRRAQVVEGPIRQFGANMEKQITGPFAGGAALSIADIKLFVVVGWIKKGVLDHIPANALDGFPKLQAVFENVKSHPKIVEWYGRAR